MSFDYESHDLKWEALTSIDKRHIKKLQIFLGNPDLDLWSADEAHFQLHGSRCRMWIPPEDTDPVYFHCPTRKSVGYFGAVRLRDGKLVYQRATGKFNGQSFQGFMTLLHKRGHQAGRKMIVVVDNARYHKSDEHEVWLSHRRGSFRLDYLPPYSPKLSLAERVWKLTRRLCTHNTYFPQIEEIAHTVEMQFEVWSRPNETLRRLCAIS